MESVVGTEHVLQGDDEIVPPGRIDRCADGRPGRFGMTRTSNGQVAQNGTTDSQSFDSWTTRGPPDSWAT